MTNRIADVWGPRTAYARGHIWPNRIDQFLADGLSEADVDWVQSACVLCSTGCGCDIAVKDGRMVGVRGRETDVVNHGRLGPKGLYGSWQPLNSPDRLTLPLVRQNGRLVEAGWDEAMNRIVAASRERLDREGPGSHGFYTSGQLFLEEYYALGILAKAGIGTPHLDGNTRLCTATAAASLKESFGADGQPGTYEDLDECEALFCYGHNMAETQTVLWARVLDRMAGPDRPALVCVDPRNTSVARAADVHLRLRPGTNLALMHGLVREVITQGWVDQDYIAAHTLGFERLADTAAPWTPERVADICGVDPGQIREAARIFGTTSRVTSTVLQGFYQAPQATASSCQVNNLHLLRGMLGKPGCGVMQMNGQPTAQNTRECGANGDLAGFRNYANPQHVKELADLWDVDADHIPHGEPPTHAMQIFELAEQGTISLLWISATNPAVSLPQLPRIREILAKPELFLVVQDLFLTETSEFADVVLPAAGWGEKTGTFTNADRVVHLSQQAVEPPGEARSDLAIFLDYAARMDSVPGAGDRYWTGRDLRTDSPRGLSAPAAGCVTTRASATNGSPAGPASPGRAAPMNPTERCGSTPTAPFPAARRSARTTGTTWQPATPWSQTNSPVWIRTAGPCSRPASSSSTPPTPRTFRCCSAPGVRSITSTPGPRPPERRSCRRRLPNPGSRSQPPTQRTWASATARSAACTRSRAASKSRHGSPTFSPGWCSRPSTTEPELEPDSIKIKRRTLMPRQQPRTS